MDLFGKPIEDSNILKKRIKNYKINLTEKLGSFSDYLRRDDKESFIRYEKNKDLIPKSFQENARKYVDNMLHSNLCESLERKFNLDYNLVREDFTIETINKLNDIGTNVLIFDIYYFAYECDISEEESKEALEYVSECSQEGHFPDDYFDQHQMQLWYDIWNKLLKGINSFKIFLEKYNKYHLNHQY